MAYHSGRDGSLYVDDVKVARVSNWSLTASVEALEVTDLGEDERCYTPGLKSASGSASIFYYDDAPVSVLEHVIKTGAVTEDDDMVELSLRWGDKQIDVDVVLTSATVACQVGSVMQADIDFTVSGDYKEVDL